MINSTCVCGKSQQVAAEFAGKQVKCPGCGQVAVMPVLVAASAIEQETAALPPALPFADSQASPGPRPMDSASNLHATIAPPRSASRRDTHETMFAALPEAQGGDGTWTLAGYRIVRELGQGGIGAVYEAEDVKLERRVALKVLKPEIAANHEQRERFLREAGTAATVESDFVCPIYEVGEDNGVPFIAMPFLKGGPLDAHLKQNLRLAIEEVVRIGKEVAEGLSAAHEAGLFHRDLKPANIWMETQRSGPRRAIILDFGLAYMQADNVQSSQVGVIAGTQLYMSPEQTRGDKNVDARTDLFSLGCLLYALCTGAAPFKGNEKMDDPAPPHTVAATTPKPLSDLVMRLLAKHPDDRPRTARDVIDKLVEIETDLPKPAQTTRISPRLSAAKSASTTVQMLSDAGETATGTQLLVPGAAPSARQRKTSYVLFTPIAVGLLACVVALAGGGVYYVVTDKGTIEIQTEYENVQVSLLKNGQEIEILDGASKKTWSFRTGKYTIRLKDDPADLEIVMPDTFELKRGDKHTVTIRKRTETPDEQVKAVVTRLMELNPGFDGKVTPTIQGGVVTGLKFLTDEVDNIAPVRALTRLTTLDCSGNQPGRGKLSDLSPLKGLPLTALNLNSCPKVRDLTPLQGMPLNFLSLDMVQVQGQVRDLEPLRGMPLTTLYLNCSQIRDLEPLKGMPLTVLNLNNCLELQDLTPLTGMPLISLSIGGIHGGTKVRDLSPLKGMPLRFLNCSDAPVSDLSPLKGMQLEDIRLTPKNITEGLDILRDMKSLKIIGIDYLQAWSAAEFRARYDKGEFKK